MTRQARFTILVRFASVALLSASSPVSGQAADVCTAEQVKAWRQLRKDNLGVHAYDPNPFLAPDIVPILGRPPEESCPSEVDFALDQEGRAHDGIHAWVYANPCKLAVCGEPQSFEENKGMAFVSGEYDLNNNLRFSPDFRSEKLAPNLCAMAAIGSDRPSRNLALQEPRLCFAETDVLHVEISPPTSFRPLFQRLWLESPPWGWLRWRNTLANRTACVYGPFVADLAHATLAEIHPTQMYWWNERAGGVAKPFEGDGPWALFLLQDASNRYTQPHHFVLEEEPPQGSVWKPWGGAPVEAVFEVPFWSRLGEPPRFDLEPYVYDGVKAPSPQPQPCTEDRIAELKTDVNGTPVVVARACNATRAGRHAAVDLDLATICRCDPKAHPPVEEAQPPAEDCPSDGFLGKLTIRAHTGRPREWDEGALGMMLLDSRSPERGSSVVVETHEAEVLPESLASLLVSWKTASGRPGWRLVEVDRGDLDEAQAAMRRLYDEARWPSSVSRPMTSLFHVSDIEVRASLMVPHLREGERSAKRLEAVHFAAKASSLLDSRDPVLLSPSGSDRGAAEQRFAFDALWAAGASPVLPFRVDIGVEATARYPEPQHVAHRETLSEPARPEKLESVWTLWTHALGSQPSSMWQQATHALCDSYLKQARGDAGADTPLATPSESAAADPMVYQNVRIATARVLKDDVVSVAELTLLVQNVERVCRRSGATEPERPVRATDGNAPSKRP